MLKNINKALDDLIKSMKIVAENLIASAPFDKTYSGIIKSINSDGTYSTVVNGKTYDLRLYIQRTLTINQSVKVIFPQNNSNNAFII